MRQTTAVAAGIAGDDDGIGRIIRNEVSHHRADARDQRGFGQPAVGKTRIVRREKAAHVRPQAHHFRRTVKPPKPESKMRTCGGFDNEPPGKRCVIITRSLALSRAKIDPFRGTRGADATVRADCVSI